MGQGAKVEIVGVETVRTFALGALYFSLAQTGFYRADNAEGDLVLNRKNVVERAIVAFCPDMPTGYGIDQLSGQSEPVARLAQAAFEHVAHTELRDRPVLHRPRDLCK